MLPSNKPPCGLIRGVFCKNEFLGGGLFEGGLFERGGLFEDLRYVSPSTSIHQKKDFLLYFDSTYFNELSKSIITTFD